MNQLYIEVIFDGDMTTYKIPDLNLEMGSMPGNSVEVTITPQDQDFRAVRLFFNRNGMCERATFPMTLRLKDVEPFVRQLCALFALDERLPFRYQEQPTGGRSKPVIAHEWLEFGYKPVLAPELDRPIARSRKKRKVS